MLANDPARGDSRDEARFRDSHCRARRQRRPGLSASCRGLEDLGYDTLWVGDRLITPVDVDSSYLAHGPQMTRSLDPVLL
jgi:alkanesulfonate monooxygenase SsuD/methylene tetrahydromethanopterin reductase-like flavin-dependent oxidoreductase (luciferase family)